MYRSTEALDQIGLGRLDDPSFVKIEMKRGSECRTSPLSISKRSSIRRDFVHNSSGFTGCFSSDASFGFCHWTGNGSGTYLQDMVFTPQTRCFFLVDVPLKADLRELCPPHQTRHPQLGSGSCGRPHAQDLEARAGAAAAEALTIDTIGSIPSFLAQHRSEGW